MQIWVAFENLFENVKLEEKNQKNCGHWKQKYVVDRRQRVKEVSTVGEKQLAQSQSRAR